MNELFIVGLCPTINTFTIHSFSLLSLVNLSFPLGSYVDPKTNRYMNVVLERVTFLKKVNGILIVR